MVIDIFSKYGWIVTLKNKKGESVVKAFKQLLKERTWPDSISGKTFTSGAGGIGFKSRAD